MREVIVIGASGEAKAVISSAKQLGWTVRAVYDDSPALWGSTLLGAPVKGPLAEATETGLSAVLALSDPLARKAAVERLVLPWLTLLHPSSFMHPSSVIGLGSVVLEGVVIQPTVTIGRFTLISANATIAHDCSIDDYACLWPGVDLAGTVSIGEGACLKIGAVVTPNVHVGDWTVVGPRSVVIRDLPDHEVVEGLPARPVH